ncbi:hypothetical protein [Microcoleus sp. B13-B6]|uniref:hypothetical protein n=1 Tax=unclassified Microcoleus TaxID=2642155 RepID=UPI002FD6F4F4
MGHRASGIGHGEWGMVASYKLLEISCKLMPNAQCPGRANAQCPMPNAQCPMPNAQFPLNN